VQKSDRRQLKKEEQLLSNGEERISAGSKDLLLEGEVRHRPEQQVERDLQESCPTPQREAEGSRVLRSNTGFVSI
jgi:hypothetical protein